jgi:hypothetical protein
MKMGLAEKQPRCARRPMPKQSVKSRGHVKRNLKRNSTVPLPCGKAVGVRTASRRHQGRSQRGAAGRQGARPEEQQRAGAGQAAKLPS